MNNQLYDFGIYIHWPYCLHKCPYCDFNSHVRPGLLDDRQFADHWLDGIQKELEFYQNVRFFPQHTNQKKPQNVIHANTNTSPLPRVKTIFFGGGTPSLIPPYALEKLLQMVTRYFTLDEDVEITLEANPTSFETEKFRAFHMAGVNRISIGVQSFHPDRLAFLGRKHDVKRAQNALLSGMEIFDNVSLDLIYATPNQDMNDWTKELSMALDFDTQHISLYQLVIEPGTKFEQLYNHGRLRPMDDDHARDMWEITCETLAKHGHHLYEISNFSKPGFESQHNLLYWQYQPYLGLGPGAHSRLWLDPSAQAHHQDLFGTAIDTKNNGTNTPHIIGLSNEKMPEKYESRMRDDGTAHKDIQMLSQREIMMEKTLMQLRLTQGIDMNEFTIFGINSDTLQDYLDFEAIEKFKNMGVVDYQDNRLFINQKHIYLADHVIREIL